MSDVTEQDWTSPEYMAMLTAEELLLAMEQLDIDVINCGFGHTEREITIAFQSIRDAERVITLGVPHDAQPGSFYDRAAASCLTLMSLGAQDEEPTEAEVDEVIDRGWLWTIHPDLNGTRMAWHVSVDLSAADAQQLTANLNAARLAGEQ